MSICLIKGILIGLLFGMPIGAVGTLTVQRTLNYGIKAGLITGSGSSATDCIYACIGAFGLTLISDFLLKYQMIINIVGGLFVAAMGISQILKKPKERQFEAEKISYAKMFLSSFAVGITNPTAILTFIFAFSYFGLSAQDGVLASIMIVLGVLIGTYFWWIAVSLLSNFIKKKNAGREFRAVNKVFGSVLLLFAAVIFFKTFGG